MNAKIRRPNRPAGFGGVTRKPTPIERDDALLAGDDFAVRLAIVSSALVTVFRGKFCDAILPNRKAITFEKDDVLYEVGGNDRTFFFLLSGFVKVGTITPDGHELIYDVRKGYDFASTDRHCHILILPNASIR